MQSCIKDSSVLIGHNVLSLWDPVVHWENQVNVKRRRHVIDAARI